MKVKEIELKGTYLNETIKLLPSHCLLNKGITGCGGTTVELESKRDSIILCPTRNLVTSKSSIGYFGVDGKVSINDIKNYLIQEKSYKKIVATYDALPKLMKAIPDYENYLLFNDYSFRSEPIRFILDNFKEFKDWCFMTATPLKDEFILDELKDIDKVNYKWTNSIPVKINIKNTCYIQKTLLEYVDLIVNKNKSGLFYDNNLKKIDIYNYNLISEIYNNSISVIGEMSEEHFTPIKSQSDNEKQVADWILNNLIKSRYTYKELETIFTPLFEEHGLKWSKNTSIKYYFPPFTKSAHTKDGVKERYYDFNIF